MIILHDCCHSHHHYRYSHHTSLSKLQFAYIGVTLSIWAYMTSAPGLPPCRVDPATILQFMSGCPVSGTVLGTGDAEMNKTQLCPDDVPGGRITEKTHRALAHLFLTNPHHLHLRYGAWFSAEEAEVDLGPAP